MWAQHALVFHILFPCSALHLQQELHNLGAPTCVMTQTGPLLSGPPFKDAPTSWAHATKQPVDRDQDCYVPLKLRTVDTGKCCCAFWAAPPEENMRFAWDPSCTASYPVLSHQGELAQCADVAVAVSGSLRTAEDSTQMFQNIERMLINTAGQANISVHVFVHIGSDVFGTDISPVPAFVKKVVVENKSDTHIDEDIATCTSGLIAHSTGTPTEPNASTLFGELARRYTTRKGLGGPHRDFLKPKLKHSTGPMYRHVFLAHDMVRTAEHDMKCTYKYILRFRPDFGGNPFDWVQVLEKLKQGKLLVGTTRWLANKRKHGVSHRHRCVVDDQLAIGTPEQMYAYSSVYPDFSDFAKYLPLYRADFGGHTNERIMAAHLHYRGLGDAFEELPYDFSYRALRT